MDISVLQDLASQNQWGSIAPELMLGCLALALLVLEVILPKNAHGIIPSVSIVGILGIVVGFFFGSSVSSAKKDATANVQATTIAAMTPGAPPAP